MTRSEKQLGAAAGLLFGGLFAYLAVDSLILSPAFELDHKALRLNGQLLDAQKRRTDSARRRLRLAAMAGRTFGDNELKVREKVRQWITLLARRSGLNTRENWDLSPLSRAPRRNIYQEVGWTISARGRLECLVNFLYLLGADRRLGRLDGLTLSPVQKSNRIRLHVRYTTILVLGEEVSSPPSPATATSRPSLDTAERKDYEAIVLRNLFQPYVRRRPPPPPRPPARRRDDRPAPTPAPREPVESRLRIVSLSKLASQPEICIRNTRSGKLTFHAPGDRLLGGTIVMVDYRPMPRIDKPEILSGSRAIVRIGSTYWAVELGQTLAQKHRLSADKLPDKLKPSPAGAPDMPQKAISHRANDRPDSDATSGKAGMR